MVGSNPVAIFKQLGLVLEGELEIFRFRKIAC